MMLVLDFRSATFAVLPSVLAGGNAGAADRAVGGQPGGLHAAQLPTVPVPEVGASAGLDHRVSLSALHTSVCRLCRS